MSKKILTRIDYEIVMQGIVNAALAGVSDETAKQKKILRRHDEALRAEVERLEQHKTKLCRLVEMAIYHENGIEGTDAQEVLADVEWEEDNAPTGWYQGLIDDLTRDRDRLAAENEKLQDVMDAAIAVRRIWWVKADLGARL